MIKRILKKFRKKVPVYIPILQSEMLIQRSALITGGSKGIGYAIAKAFVQAGAKVVITGRDKISLFSARERLIAETGVNETFVDAVVLDLHNIDSIENTISLITTTHKIDILVNNAGVSNRLNYGEMTEDEYDCVMDTNLKGVYFITQAISNYMISNGIEGNILNISSSSSLRPATLPYTLSKWGLKGLTEGLAKKMIKYNIVVNAIAPGQASTSMIGNGEDLNSPRNPINRLITPTEIANMAVILVSDLGRSVVGDTIYMTGGSGLITFDDIDY